MLSKYLSSIVKTSSSVELCEDKEILDSTFSQSLAIANEFLKCGKIIGISEGNKHQLVSLSGCKKMFTIEGGELVKYEDINVKEIQEKCLESADYCLYFR